MESGALGNVIQYGKINRCVITIVNVMTVGAEDLKVGYRCSCNAPSVVIVEVQVPRRSMVGGGLFFEHSYCFPCFFWAATHGMFISFHGNLIEVFLLGVSLHTMVSTTGGVPVFFVSVRTVSKKLFVCILSSITKRVAEKGLCAGPGAPDEEKRRERCSPDKIHFCSHQRRESLPWQQAHKLDSIKSHKALFLVDALRVNIISGNTLFVSLQNAPPTGRILRLHCRAATNSLQGELC